jgi:hypothetical protein
MALVAFGVARGRLTSAQCQGLNQSQEIPPSVAEAMAGRHYVRNDKTNHNEGLVSPSL